MADFVKKVEWITHLSVCKTKKLIGELEALD